MKIGLQIYHFDWPGSPRNIGAKLVEIAKIAEDAGVSSLWIMDHFFQVGQGFGPPEAMNSTQVVELCQGLAEMGFQQVIFNMPNVHEIEPIEIIGQEVMPHIAYMT